MTRHLDEVRSSFLVKDRGLTWPVGDDGETMLRLHTARGWLQLAQELVDMLRGQSSASEMPKVCRLLS